MHFASAWERLRRTNLGLSQNAVVQSLRDVGLSITRPAVSAWGSGSTLPTPGHLWGLKVALPLSDEDFGRLIKAWLADHFARTRARARERAPTIGLGR